MEHIHYENIIQETVKHFKKLRQKNGLSHDNLAKKAGITRAAISHIEKGVRRPSLLVALNIAQALEVNLSDILQQTETSSHNRKENKKSKQPTN